MKGLSADDYILLITDALNDLDLPLAQRHWQDMRAEWPAEADRAAAITRRAGRRKLA